ncbi:MAG: hypothetical protein K2O04_03095 [Clostridiales bacterium]|nr:hypothetical protein [Clostridiales bacterium]
MAYSAISIVCILIMLAIVVYLIVKFLRCNRSGKIEFIKNFKKGKCAIIYVVAVPLYIMAALYANKSILYAIFYSISTAVQLVVVKFDVSPALISDNVFFAVALYVCLTLVVLNAIMITASVLHQWIWKNHRLFWFSRKKENKCIIVGNTDRGIAVYRSCNQPKLIIDCMSASEREKLYIQGTTYHSCVREERLFDWLDKELKSQVKRLSKHGKKAVVIMNGDDDEVNLRRCGMLLKIIDTMGDDVATGVEIYAFGNREYEDIYGKYEDMSKGCLHYVNEYRQIAIDFIDRYPFTEYMDETHIDYTTGLLRPQTEINVALIGFGRTNQQIFLSSVENNRFLSTDKNGRVAEKQVRYHVFDKSHEDMYKSLNSNYFRYRHEFLAEGSAVDASDYLPLPPVPSLDDYYNVDINDTDFFRSLENALSFKSQTVNYVIVSIGADYAGIDVANKITARLKERDARNTHVFVRIRDDKILDSSNIFLYDDMCTPFGANKAVAYNYSNIIREKFAEMAIMRNFVYDIEHDMKHSRVTAEEVQTSRHKWYVKLTSIERDSNMYACLGLRQKLHLMGLDYCAAGDDKTGLSEDEYFSRYAKNDMPDFVLDNNGQKVAVRYPIEYKPSLRANLAIQEHCRWNAFMFAKGFMPASKDSILNEVDGGGKHTNGKNIAKRRHGCLTTFVGLIDFRKMIAKRDGVVEADRDVIKYDYQLLDSAWWLLNNNGYKIFERRG